MNFKGFVDYIIGNLISPFFGILVGAAVVYFMWSIFGVIKNADQAEELAKMKQKAVWGAIGIAVMVSMWGLVNFITGSLKLDTSSSPLQQLINNTAGNSGRNYPAPSSGNSGASSISTNVNGLVNEGLTPPQSQSSMPINPVPCYNGTPCYPAQ